MQIDEMSSERISILIENNLTDWKLEICEGRERERERVRRNLRILLRVGISVWDRRGGKMINPSLAQLCCVNFSFSKLSNPGPCLRSLTLVFVTILRKIFQGYSTHLVGKTKLSWLGFRIFYSVENPNEKMELESSYIILQAFSFITT